MFSRAASSAAMLAFAAVAHAHVAGDHATLLRTHDVGHELDSVSLMSTDGFLREAGAELAEVRPHKVAELQEVYEVVPPSMSTIQYVTASMPDRGYGRISQQVIYHNLWEELETFPMRKPRTFNMIIATVKTWGADFCVQLLELRSRSSGVKTGVDWLRSFAFAIFGFLYVGCVQWVLYVSLLTYLAPSAIEFSNEPWSAKMHNIAGQEDLLKQVLVDNLFFNAFIYFPSFYMLKEFVNARCTRLGALGDGLRRYHQNFISDNLLSMVFWVPGDFVAFAAPIYLRLPLDHLVSFSWTMVLSYRRGSTTVAPLATTDKHAAFDSVGQGSTKDGAQKSDCASCVGL